MKNNIIYFLLFIVCSCTTSKEVILVHKYDTNLPVKVIIAKSYPDSTLTHLLIPYELEVQNSYNNKIRLSRTGLSITGGNVYGTRGTNMFGLKDSLTYPPHKMGFSRNQKERFKLYASYFTYITDTEKNRIISTGHFVQNYGKYKRPVYDIGSIKMNETWLHEKVPDSLRGYIRFSFRNTKTDESIYKNVQITF